MAVKSITLRLLKSLLKTKPKNTAAYYDTRLTGFMCRIYPSGRISYYSIFKLGKSNSYKPIYRHIGNFPSIHPQDARLICKSDQLDVALGKNPLDKQIPPPQTQNNNDFCYYMDKFVDEHVQQKKPETILFYNKIIRLHIIPYFKEKNITEIKQSDVLIIKKNMESIKTTYNRTHAVMSRFFNWCLQYEIIKNHPLLGIKKYPENRKQDYLTQEQYKTIIASINRLLNNKTITQSCASCYLFLILTGCRVGESLSLKWEYIDYTNDTIKLPDTKTGAKTLYIGNTIKYLLKSLPQKNAYVFYSPFKRGHIVDVYRPFKLVLADAGLPAHYSIHILRHSYISTGANSNLPLNAVQLAVSHKSLHTTERYTHTNQKLAESTAQKIESIISSPSQDTIKNIIAAL